MLSGVVVVVVAIAVVLVDAVLDTVAATGRVRPDVLQAAMSATQVAASVRWPIIVPPLFAIEACVARFICTFPARSRARGPATMPRVRNRYTDDAHRA